MVTGNSQEEVIIFRDKQTDMHHNIYIITIIMMMITGDPCGCGQVPSDPQQQGDPHHLGGRDSKSAAVKVPFLTIIKIPAPF